MKILVRDNLGNNIPDALVYNGETNYTTDENGRVEVEDIGKPFVFAAVGHRNATFNLSGKANVTVELQRISGDLETVEITAEKPKKKNVSLMLILILAYISTR